jgi:hypothetical protein
MPPEEAGYTYAVEPTAIDRLLANEEESIYGLPWPMYWLSGLMRDLLSDYRN